MQKSAISYMTNLNSLHLYSTLYWELFLQNCTNQNNVKVENQNLANLAWNEFCEW